MDRSQAAFVTVAVHGAAEEHIANSTPQQRVTKLGAAAFKRPARATTGGDFECNRDRHLPSNSTNESNPSYSPLGHVGHFDPVLLAEFFALYPSMILALSFSASSCCHTFYRFR